MKDSFFEDKYLTEFCLAGLEHKLPKWSWKANLLIRAKVDAARQADRGLTAS